MAPIHSLFARIAQHHADKGLSARSTRIDCEFLRDIIQRKDIYGISGKQDEQDLVPILAQHRDKWPVFAGYVMEIINGSRSSATPTTASTEATSTVVGSTGAILSAFQNFGMINRAITAQMEKENSIVTRDNIPVGVNTTLRHWYQQGLFSMAEREEVKRITRPYTIARLYADIRNSTHASQCDWIDFMTVHKSDYYGLKKSNEVIQLVDALSLLLEQKGGAALGFCNYIRTFLLAKARLEFFASPAASAPAEETHIPTPTKVKDISSETTKMEEVEKTLTKQVMSTVTEHVSEYQERIKELESQLQKLQSELQESRAMTATLIETQKEMLRLMKKP